MSLLNPLAMAAAVVSELKQIRELVRTAVETHSEDRIGSRAFNAKATATIAGGTNGQVLLTVTPPQGYAWRLQWLALEASLWKGDAGGGAIVQLLRGKGALIGWDNLTWPWGTIREPRRVYLAGGGNEPLVVRASNSQAFASTEVCVVVGGIFYSAEGGGS